MHVVRTHDTSPLSPARKRNNFKWRRLHAPAFAKASAGKPCGGWSRLAMFRALRTSTNTGVNVARERD